MWALHEGAAGPIAEPAAVSEPARRPTSSNIKTILKGQAARCGRYRNLNERVWYTSACQGALDGASTPGTKAITAEAFRIDALLATRESLTSTCPRSENLDEAIFASNRYAGSGGMVPRAN